MRVGAAACALLVCVGGASAAGSAPGGPGALSYFDLARKDCVGTSRTSASKVWYTVAGGVLSDVYVPDHRQHERRDAAVRRERRQRPSPTCRTRDMTYKVTALDDGGMVCRVTTHGQERRLPDRHRLRHRPGAEHASSRARQLTARSAARTTTLYVRFDPTVNGNGGGGAGNGGARQRGRRHLDRASGPRRLRHRAPPPTRRTATTPSRCTRRSTRTRSCGDATASPARPATA